MTSVVCKDGNVVMRSVASWLVVVSGPTTAWSQYRKSV